ncbi:hypothetical protein HY972_02860 [Candidatus Kaiserbacteria bacterium]|nr:hypothetical protein [Candidatus Kaiserbacteria bacterium]
MTHLLFIFVSVALLLGFLVLSRYEERHSTRLFAPARARLDERVARIGFVFTHVDFAAFAREEARRASARVGHDIAHLSLQAVRLAERLLTRLVRRLRVHNEAGIALAPRASTRPFVQALSDFKNRLKATRPEMSDTPQ